MNVEIGAEAALFPEKEYINGIAVAVLFMLFIQWALWTEKIREICEIWTFLHPKPGRQILSSTSIFKKEEIFHDLNFDLWGEGAGAIAGVMNEAEKLNKQCLCAF